MRVAHNPDFTIITETADYIVVDKPAPLLIHPSVPGNPPTLLDGLQALLAYELANGATLSIINRLDRETSGVVIVAKNRETARKLSLAMQERRVQKEYVAIVHGTPKNDRFTISDPILRAGQVEESAIWVKQIPHPAGAPCYTEFETLKKQGDLTLLRVLPKTGRMHQIRVHAKQAGLPIVGDKIYGPDENCYLDFIENGWTDKLKDTLLMPRQALHCQSMSIPEFGEWQSELPVEFEHLLTSHCPTSKVAAATNES